MKSLTFPIKSLIADFKVKSFIDAVISHVCTENTTKSEMLRWEFTNWKIQLGTITNYSKCLLY